MFTRITPLTYKEVTSALKRLGFEMKPKTATAHEQWIRVDDRGKFLVTVDKHISPFDKVLIKSMARQAGLSSKEFYKECKKK
ncbi:type II toxin-antitoxin system HicA family toxin [Pasteurella multocida]|uniref:type II toxin-antitoxin system HicA family toxin n=1 Tax=Pasteurella multocida TaxID=747 RepID=UPI002340BC80|nr:type II toxin-antitoxin system HicA family toxin [Pasteurella multocida]MDC4238426.1 type II toxin-antitoxin system HicA family toxin [Pasteurella multocida]